MSNFIRKLNNSWLQTIVLVALLVAMNISIEKLTDQKITGAEILFIRAICNLVLALAIAALNKKSVIPKQPKLQLGAFICLGLSLLLVFTAYQYISAGSVSTLLRLDIPLLTLIALFSSKSSTKQVILSIIAFALVATLLMLNKSTNESPFGYVLVLTGVVVIAINTLLQKKIAVTENIETIMIVVSLSSVFWGGIRCWQAHSTFSNITSTLLFAIVGLSLINLVVFYLVNDLYKKYSPEFVRYPYLIAAFGTMIVEMIIKQKLFSPLLIGGNIAILITLTLLVRSRQKQNDQTIIDKQSTV